MGRIKYSLLTLLALFSFILIVAFPSAPLAQEKTIPRGTLKVVTLLEGPHYVRSNYAEGLVTLDKDNNVIPCLAESWSWIEERTMEFRLRQGSGPTRPWVSMTALASGRASQVPSFPTTSTQGSGT